jgi:hypothetical protein
MKQHYSQTDKLIPGETWCSVCGVKVQLYLKKIADEHIKGKKHQKMLKEVKFIELDFE